MIRNYNKESNLISSNKRINEKLMVLGIYNEFCNDILDATADENLKEEYALIMAKTFEVTVRKINYQKRRNVGPDRFMSMYFKILKETKIASALPFSYVIANFENQLHNYSETMKFVNMIDEFEELAFNTKIQIMQEFRESVNRVLTSIGEIYGYENSCNLRNNLLRVLTNNFANYLKTCKAENIAPSVITGNVKPYMMNIAKNFLVYQLNGYRFDFLNVKDSNTKAFLDSFNDLEQDIWIMSLIFEIAGYNDNEKLMDSSKVKEICKLLHISKIRYTLTTLSMGLRSLNNLSILRNGVDNSNNETRERKRN